MKQTKYTRSAKGKPCQVRVPGVCREAPENDTTVSAHLNGAGGGMKSLDIHIAYACFYCHNWLDGGYITSRVFSVPRQERDLLHLEAIIRTQAIMVEDGILKL